MLKYIQFWVSNRFDNIDLFESFADRVWPGYENFTAGDLAERDNEYLDTLDRNLKHKNVKEIHLFYIYEDALSVSWTVEHFQTF